MINYWNEILDGNGSGILNGYGSEILDDGLWGRDICW